MNSVSIDFLNRLATDVPMMHSGLLAVLASLDVAAAEDQWRTKVRAQMAPKIQMTDDGFARIPVHGALGRRPSLYELSKGEVEDSDAIRGLVQQAADSSKMKGILLAVDSPGGWFGGGVELADAVHEASRQKPVVAHIAGLGASLAYMISSQSNVIVASPSASVGSIGTYMIHADMSKMMERFGVKLEVFRNKDGELKAPGVGGTELTDVQREHIQARTDAAHSVFVSLVGRRRKIARENMRGQTWHGEEAMKLGLVDHVGSEASALTLLRRMHG